MRALFIEKILSTFVEVVHSSGAYMISYGLSNASVPYNSPISFAVGVSPYMLRSNSFTQSINVTTSCSDMSLKQA